MSRSKNTCCDQISKTLFFREPKNGFCALFLENMSQDKLLLNRLVKFGVPNILLSVRSEIWQ